MAADRQADRIARQLKIFLNNASKRGVGRSSQRSSSVAEIVSPVVMFGLEQLRRSAPRQATKILAPSAWTSLAGHLTARLAFALTPTLRLEQRATKAVARSLEKRNRRRALEIELSETICAFPGVLDTAARLITSWLEAQRELLTRLVQDRRILSSFFLRDRQRFRVISIRPGLSDPHDGGRSVTLIELNGNRRVIYKPRPLDGEQLWFSVLGWLNRNGIGTHFRQPRLFSQSKHSWMEFLGRRSCQNSEEVRRFYFRWGAQVAVAQILRSSDLHRENWIAAGSQPVLVDAELIGRGRQDRRSLPAVLETGLLPLTARDRVGFYQGIAPLDATLSRGEAANCWPRYQGGARAPSKYVNELVRGFEAVANVFARPERAKQFFDEIVLAKTPKTNARLLLRPSAAYARLLCRSLDPPNMISQGQRWRWLARECCASAANRSIGLAEARALRRCDIPKFTQRIAALSRERFSAAIAELKNSTRLLRSRVALGAGARRD